ncbi:Dps family protein [Oligoflexus tunisiensis]|uniref:Dps family protein n=1 Tax=Oligoflexus tunisiensis TaxID=708132 RepID=UPI000A9CF885|nr:DNA starvation/stationary phase protection protein [Oligoflexus tunisiensis]
MTQVSDSLQLLQADALVMFTKVHNYHWNVRGPQFYGVHARTEEIYEQFATIYDDVAERMLQLGATPLLTLKDILAKARVKEETETRFSPEQVVQSLVKDFEHFLKEFRNLESIARDDSTTTAYAQEKIAGFEKQIWMLKANIS